MTDLDHLWKQDRQEYRRVAAAIFRYAAEMVRAGKSADEIEKRAEQIEREISKKKESGTGEIV